VNPDEVERRVRAVLDRLFGLDPPSRDTDLFESDLLDSLGVVNLIAELEAEFNLELPLDELDIDAFGNVERIVGLLSETLENAA
jgi:acyl carrier protein